MFRHEILGGLVQVYRREGTRHWHCSASLKGVRYRATTKEEDLPQAQQFAEDWYLELRGKSRAGMLKKSEKTFAEAAEQFLKEYETITEGQRSPARYGFRATESGSAFTSCLSSERLISPM